MNKRDFFTMLKVGAIMLFCTWVLSANAQNCPNDVTPPVFKDCNFTFNGNDGSQILLLVDSDSTILSTASFPAISDDCDANPTIRLVVGAIENQRFRGKIGDGSVLRFEAIDRSLNRSECLVRYSFLKRKCKGDSTCITFPSSGNVSDYIVVSSSGAAIAQNRLQEKRDTVDDVGEAICFANQQPFSLKIYMPTKDFILSNPDDFTLASLVAFNPITITPCNPCDSDTIPPIFTGFNYTLTDFAPTTRVKFVSILTDKDSILFASLPLPTASDNCDANPIVKVLRLPSNDFKYLKGSFTANIAYEATDKLGNKTEGVIVYRLFKRVCVAGKTCINFPINSNSSDYIVVSSSQNISITRLSGERSDTLSNIGGQICFDYSAPFYFQPFLRVGNIPLERFLVIPCNPCDFDTIPPRFLSCPNSLIVDTRTNACATATRATSTATDNCGTPSLSSNYPENYCFPVGKTTVIYTAKDQANNTATCQFDVTVRVVQEQICKSYDALNTNLACGCEATKFQPYGFYLDGANGCSADFFKPDGALRFQMNADNTATLKGNFRNNRTWELVVADITLSGRTTSPPTGSPNLAFCQQGRSSAVANAWQYFTGMTGTFKIDAKTLTVNRFGAAFQVGVGANGQNVEKMGASGGFTLSDGKTGSFGLILGNELSFACGDSGGTASANDVAVSIRSSSATYERYTTTTYSISAKNIGTTTMQNVVVEFRFPSGTVNGGAIRPSIGKWEEICADNAPCFKWTIPALAVGQEAVLTVPLFVLDVNIPIVATAKLLATSPTDGNAANNIATTTITRFGSPIAPLIAQKPTQLIPFVIQKLAPNPTENELLLELESLKDSEVTLNFSTPMGQVIRSEKVEVAKGTNRIRLDVSAFAQGIYFVTPSTNTSRNLPIKFVKM